MADRVPLLSSLREPPRLSQRYLVPVIVGYIYCGLSGTWPVLGPKHTDADFFEFDQAHYHVDMRFLTAAQERRVLAMGQECGRDTLEDIVQAYPLHYRGLPLPKGRPPLKPRVCRHVDVRYAHGDKDPIHRLNAHYRSPAQPIRRPDGRLLCPHRKVDLSQFPVDGDGVVTCPLHGLKVCVRAPLEVAA